eukprot:3940959-Rhodomonas_salina.2
MSSRKDGVSCGKILGTIAGALYVLLVLQAHPPRQSKRQAREQRASRRALDRYPAALKRSEIRAAHFPCLAAHTLCEYLHPVQWRAQIEQLTRTKRNLANPLSEREG